MNNLIDKQTWLDGTISFQKYTKDWMFWWQDQYIWKHNIDKHPFLTHQKAFAVQKEWVYKLSGWIYQRNLINSGSYCLREFIYNIHNICILSWFSWYSPLLSFKFFVLGWFFFIKYVLITVSPLPTPPRFSNLQQPKSVQFFLSLSLKQKQSIK